MAIFGAPLVQEKPRCAHPAPLSPDIPEGYPKCGSFTPVFPVALLGAAGSCAEALGRTGRDGAAPCSALAASPETKPHQKDKNGPKAMPDVCHGPCRMCPGVAKPWLQQLPGRVSRWLCAGRTGTRRWHQPPLLGLGTKGTEGRDVSPSCPFPSPPSRLLAVLFGPNPPRLGGSDLCSRTGDGFSIYFCTLYNVDV